MNKSIYIALSMILVVILSGCIEQEIKPEETSADNDLMQVDEVNRIKSASDIYQTGDYYFDLAKSVNENGIDTYKLGDQLKIETNDKQTYSLYYSTEEFVDYQAIDHVEFTGQYIVDTKVPMFYLLVGENGEIDVTISTV